MYQAETNNLILEIDPLDTQEEIPTEVLTGVIEHYGLFVEWLNNPAYINESMMVAFEEQYKFPIMNIGYEPDENGVLHSEYEEDADLNPVMKVVRKNNDNEIALFYQYGIVGLFDMERKLATVVRMD